MTSDSNRRIEIFMLGIAGFAVAWLTYTFTAGIFSFASTNAERGVIIKSHERRIATLEEQMDKLQWGIKPNNLKEKN